jgi:hypothetical protein
MSKAQTAPTTSTMQRQLSGVDSLFYLGASLVIVSSIAAVFLR